MVCNQCIHYIIHSFHKDFPEKFEKYYCRYHLTNEKEFCKRFSARVLYEDAEEI